MYIKMQEGWWRCEGGRWHPSWTRRIRRPTPADRRHSPHSRHMMIISIQRPTTPNPVSRAEPSAGEHCVGSTYYPPYPPQSPGGAAHTKDGKRVIPTSSKQPAYVARTSHVPMQISSAKCDAMLRQAIMFSELDDKWYSNRFKRIIYQNNSLVSAIPVICHSWWEPMTIIIKSN